MTEIRRRIVAVVACDPAQQVALFPVLQEQGYAVVALPGVDEALATFKSEPPDLFVCGLTVPDLDGWRLCRLLRSSESPYFSDVPILLLSETLTGVEAEATTAALGGDGLLPFPVDAGRLLDTVRQLLSDGHSGRSAHQGRPEAVIERYREVFAHLLDGCALHEVIWDDQSRPVDLRFLSVNRAFERMIGLPAASILGRTVSEVLPGTGSNCMASCGRVALTGDTDRFESHHAGLDKHFEVVAFRSAPGQVACVFKDITERKQQEKRAARLSSLSELLSQVDQAILRAASPLELFESTCRIATKCGRFRLTWVGLVDEGTGEIRQFAQDADAQGFPYPIRASQCDINHQAIAEGRPVICNSMSPSQSKADCHLHAMESDIRSCAAFPIRLRGKACGTLCVHSAEPGFFQDEEVKRLEEVALEISFALDALEADRARREVEERFAATFEHFPAPAAINILEDGTQLNVNRQFEAVFGFSKAEAIGKRPWELGMVTKESYTRLGGLLASQGRIAGEEIRVRAKDGREVDCILNAEVITVGGQPRSLWMMVDVTRRKQMEEALRHGEETLRQLCDSALDAIVMIDDRGKAILWNSAAERMFGYTASEILGQPIHDLLAPDRDRSYFQANFPLFQQTGYGALIGKVVEVKGRKKDGSEFPIELSLGAVQRLPQWQAVAIVRDATARHESRKLLEDANARYNLLAEQSRTIVWEVNAEGLYTYVSPVAETAWDYRPEELVGRKYLYEIRPEEGRDEFKAAVFEVFARKGNFRDFESSVRRKDGRIVLVATSAGPVLGESGELLGYRGSTTDITDRKRAEEETRLSELRYRSLIEHMLNGVAYGKMLYDEQGRPVDFIHLQVNAAFERLTGIRDAAGKRMSEVMPGIGAQKPELFEACGRVAATGTAEHFESYFPPLARWFSNSVYSPQEGYFVAVFEDITGRKQNVADRDTMMALLRLLNTPSDTRELIRAANGLLQEWSGCEAVAVRLREGDDFPYYETRGLSTDFVEADNSLCARDAAGELLRDSLGKPVLDGLCGDLLSGYFDPDLPYFTRGGSYWTNSGSRLLASSAETERRTHLRSLSYAADFDSVALIPLRSSGQMLGLMQFHDRRPGRFTPEKIAVMERAAASLAIGLEQRKTQAAIVNTEKRYRLISENTADVIWLLDVDSRRLTYVSPAVQRLLGYSPEEIMAKDIQDFLTPETYRYIVRRLQEVLPAFEAGDESMRTVAHELEQVRKDGSVVRTEIVTTLLPEAKGRVTEILGVTRDITERVQAQARLMQAQKMESVGRLAGGVAHDFNNLLTVINGYSQLLLGKLSVGDPLRDNLEEIYKAGTRAARLTQQLLAFSRKQVLKPIVLDLNHVVAEMQPMLERMVGEDVELQVELYPEATTICADPHQLDQVMMNLAVNSRDAMPSGGKLTIETAVVEVGESRAQTATGEASGSYVVLAVSDTGVGMSEDTRQHIFEPFFTTKEVGKGTGLGLSMIQGIVAQSGGYIEVSSEIGRGTTFKIYLPRVENRAAESGRPEAAAAIEGRETVLVVEDQAEVRKYAAAALRAYGYHVIQAENAGEAIRLCERESERIDMVLTDVVMPNMSGRELADRLGQRWPGIKVLFMSGYTDDAITRHGVLEKDAEFIQKPFSPDQLAGKVREVLGASGQPARILVTDDQPEVRSFLRAVLEDGGYTVIEAADGKQAVKAVRTGRVDLVIMDLVMPVQEGIETIPVLHKEFPGIGIIAMSGAFGGEFLKPALKLGADAILAKPVGADVLLAKVAEVLHSRR